jgi:hypothetical protein
VNLINDFKGLNLISFELTKPQLNVIQTLTQSRIFLHGPAGVGKTTAAVHRMQYLINRGVPAESILVLVPQRSLARGFAESIRVPDFKPGGEPSILTIGGLAQRMIALFWPLAARNSGFLDPRRPPQFLTLETAQYYLAGLVSPLIQNGYFENITVDQNRLYSQILDNLNKSAVVGFPPEEISARLIQAWAGKPTQSIIYDQAQECALLFRTFCLENNLLDFSLQLSLFREHLWPSLLCRKYLQKNYQNLIYDNVEEDYPVAHDIIKEWLPEFRSSLIIFDTDAGFRSFLGADPVSARTIEQSCDLRVEFQDSFVKTPGLQNLESSLSTSLLEHRISTPIEKNIIDSFSVHSFRFYPQVMEWVASEVSQLITSRGVLPQEIAVLTPFLSDSLRYSFTSIFSEKEIPFSTFRPSRSLKDEPTVRAMISLAKLAYTSWGYQPSKDEVRNALLLSVSDCDLIRADLLTQMLYSSTNSQAVLRSFDPVKKEMQQRITYSIGERFEDLRKWLLLATNQDTLDLDVFFGKLFGEKLSQPGYKFHDNFDAAASANRLIESCRKFRLAISQTPRSTNTLIGKEYIRLVDEGIIASQYLLDWTDQAHSESVLIAPAYSFLMSNRPVQYQFWLDIGSNGWWTRLDQPLTQPYVLNRNWTKGNLWTDEFEYLTNQKTLARITSGMIRRCSNHVYMCTLGVNEQGSEERGALLLSIQTILRKLKTMGAA